MEDWTILLSGIVGSTAYGLDTPESDIDRLAVCAAPTRSFHGLRGPQETYVFHEPDFTAHEIGKFARLALSCNPTVNELLWLESYETIRPVWGMRLVEIRRSFLSAQLVRNAYLGYAQQQFQRLKRRGDGSFSADTRKRTAKHARHLARLCDQGYGLYATGKLYVRVDDPGWYRNFGEKVAEGRLDLAEGFLAKAEERFDRTVSVLAERPDERRVEEFLRDLRRDLFERNP